MFRFLMLFCVSLLSLSTRVAADKPNFLIILADDCTFNDLPLYGGENAQTPNIDRLASQGLTFQRAYLSEAMCQPCRSELYTGQFPLRNGSAWNHAASRPETISMPQRLSAAGYRVGIAGKVHVKPKQVFPFEPVAGFDPNCVRDPTQPSDRKPLAEFIERSGEPFCMVVALVEPHVPWVMGDASAYPPAKLKLPPNLADTAVTRDAYSRYLAEITYMDGQVGQVLQTLDDAGKTDDTVVIFSSEQGAQFPGCKWTNWDTGLHTALVARWPGKIAARRRTDAIVQYADVLPTFLELAGVDTPVDAAPVMDGRSFAAVLRGETDTHRDVAFGLHNNIPEGPAFPSRTITDGRYRYIRNLTPNELFIEKHLMGIQGDGKLNNKYWFSWVGEALEDPRTYELIKRYTQRPAEALYETSADPYEMTNLATDPQYDSVRQALSDRLDVWLAEQHDPGVAVDTREALQAARKGQHLYGAPLTP